MLNYNTTSINKRIVQVLEERFSCTVFMIKLKGGSLLCIVLCHCFLSYDKRNCGVTIFFKLNLYFI